jgi:hypothetical protein
VQVEDNDMKAKQFQWRNEKMGVDSTRILKIQKHFGYKSYIKDVKIDGI